MSNRLQYETSPYLLQHATNPVNWYPWGEEAFDKAKTENKPIFLSIGYSTCHWCHVMAHESFENTKIASVLNEYFVCIKVDREERPDVDHVYMTVCQALTGSGGWPTTLFLTPDKKPFFAGTYFPPTAHNGMPGFFDLIHNIANYWQHDREKLLTSAENITQYLGKPLQATSNLPKANLPHKAFEEFCKIYDEKNGGFGMAPKFPTPHNLIFLLLYGKIFNNSKATDMALHTLKQMQKGGIYDHIGGGFSRYSTDTKFLVPHFEKMLYDNALLIIAYSTAYSAGGENIFLNTAEKCAEYLLKEMSNSKFGFFSAQDADSLGKEGAYYLFDYDEILSVLGDQKGKLFCECFDIKKEGNFNGKNILNLLNNKNALSADTAFKNELQLLYNYRKNRMQLNLDDKILTSWNALAISAFCCLYRVTGKQKYLETALKTTEFIEKELCKNNRLYVSVRNGKKSTKGFLDDYAYFAVSYIFLFSATGETSYLNRAENFCKIAIELFSDDNGGFNINGKENEKMIFSAKETFDRAMPSGNSMIFFLLTRLCQIDKYPELEKIKQKQEEFLLNTASEYPIGHTMFFISLLFAEKTPPKIVVVCTPNDTLDSVSKNIPLYADIKILKTETDQYKILNGKTTYYVCNNNSCLPPTNNLNTTI